MTVSAIVDRSLESQPSRVVFLGFLGSDEEINVAFAREAAPQRSAINFQRSLLGALRDAGVATYTIGTLPVMAFPRNRAFFSGASSEGGETIPLLNLPGLRMVWRTVVFFSRLMSVVNRSDVILVYSLHTPLLLAASVAARMKRVRLGIVIPDLPLFMDSEYSGVLRGWLKALDNRLLKWLAGKADVSFPITSRIANDWLNRSSGYVVVEGISPSTMQPFNNSARPRRPLLLYTGNFSHILKCVEMFRRSAIDAELVLIGAGPERPALESLAGQDPRIRVKGFMEPDALQSEVEKSSFLINLRDTAWPGGRYSFPSKLVEYIRQGRPVISTRLDGIPVEYFDYFFPLDDRNDAAFAQSLATAIAADRSYLEAAVSGAQAMLRERKSSLVVGRRIIEALLRA